MFTPFHAFSAGWIPELPVVESLYYFGHCIKNVFDVVFDVLYFHLFVYYFAVESRKVYNMFLNY